MQHPVVLDVWSHTNNNFEILEEPLGKSDDWLFGLEAQIVCP